MRTHLAISRTDSGFSLALVATMLAISFLMVTGLLQYVETNSRFSAQHQEYEKDAAAAEAATEKIVSLMHQDLFLGGPSRVASQFVNYSVQVPSIMETPHWGAYEFSTPLGTLDQTLVSKVSSGASPLLWNYEPWIVQNSLYRIISNAENVGNGTGLKVGLRQDIQVVEIPIFLFAFFYDSAITFNPWHDFSITGRVHSNGDVFCEPQSGSSLLFLDHITASGQLLHEVNPFNPTPHALGSISYGQEHDSEIAPMALPLGTNDPGTIIQPISVSSFPAIDSQRFINLADLKIFVEDASVVVRDSTDALVPTNYYQNFISTNQTFYDKREARWTKVTELDLSQFNSDFATLQAVLPTALTTVYVADLRTSDPINYFPSVRLVNGQVLDHPLTLATMNPVYIQGNFNAPSGATNLTGTVPAAVIADAVTILSSDWDDSDSEEGLWTGHRDAVTTALNAAILTGTLPSSAASGYDGGFLNCLRLLERWSGETLHFNGSFVTLYRSRIANQPWGNSDVYHAPVRSFHFNPNFLNAGSRPPNTPVFPVLIRAEWKTIVSGATY